MTEYPATRFVSLGAGVQSTVLLLMGEQGAFGDPPDAAIFADTGWEPVQVYAHLDWLESQTSIPIHRVTGGSSLYDDTLSGVTHDGSKYCGIPAFMLNKNGKKGQSNRQCTSNYKVLPIHRKARELVGVGPRSHAPAGMIEQWVGISKDEIHRMKSSRVQYITSRWPLIEAGMSRLDCLAWFQEKYPGRPLVKSSCIGCPYHSDKQWLELSRADPEGMQRTIELDHSLRLPGRFGDDSPRYLHGSLRPLDQVLERLERVDAEGQQLSMLDGMGNECEGLCGV